MLKNVAILGVWRGFWVKFRAQRRRKIAAHEFWDRLICLPLFGGGVKGLYYDANEAGASCVLVPCWRDELCELPEID